jgi:predicted transposase YdaD
VAVAWRTEGVEIGIAQRNVEMAQAMVQEGMGIALIAKLTGLSPEEVAKLKP